MERGRVDRVGRSERGCVRVRRDGARRMPAGLHDDYRLQPCGGARGRHELARVTDRFDVQQYRARMPVAREVIEEIGEIDVQRVAERGDGRKADLAAHAPFDERGGDRGRLRHQCDVARQRRVRGEARVEPRMRRDHAQAVGPGQAHAVGARDVLQFRCERPFALPQPGAQHDRGGSAVLGGGLRVFGDHRGRCGDQHQFGHEGQVGHARDGRDALDLAMPRIDQADAAGEAAGLQVAQHRATDRTLARATADHGDGGGREQRWEGIGAHRARCQSDIMRHHHARGHVQVSS